MTDREIFEKETGIDISEWIQPDNVYLIDNEYIKKLYQYIEWLEKSSEWVSVEDRLPEVNISGLSDVVNIIHSYSNMPEGAVYDKHSKCWYTNRTSIADSDVQYWQRTYLPTSPDEAKRGERVNDKEIIIELRKLVEYQQAYINYLLGSLDGGDFNEYCEIIAGKVMSLEEIEKIIIEASP